MTAGVGMRALLVVAAALLWMVPAAVAGFLHLRALEHAWREERLARLADRGELVARQLARGIEHARADLAWLAAGLDPRDPAAARARLDVASGPDSRYPWLGLADLSGRIVAAAPSGSAGHLASDRPWFAAGLRRSYAGTPPSAEVSERAEPVPEESTPAKEIELAVPVEAGGRTAGVLAARIGWAWLAQVLEDRPADGIAVMVIGRQGEVLLDAAGAARARLAPAIGQWAAQGRRQAGLELWPDGRSYLSAVVPAVPVRDRHGFGWSVVVRQDAAAALAPVRAAARSFLACMAAAATVSLLALAALARYLAAPFSRLAAFAGALAGRAPAEVPPEESAFAEAHRLAVALTRLQARMLTAEGDREERRSQAELAA